jgi:hypothetical protein
VSWPTNLSADTFARPEGREDHVLDVYLDTKGEIVDAKLDGESFWPAWFKVEFKGNGELSAKVHGLRMSTRLGDEVHFHTISD